jgi:hypothetical protein
VRISSQALSRPDHRLYVKFSGDRELIGLETFSTMTRAPAQRSVVLAQRSCQFQTAFRQARAAATYDLATFARLRFRGLLLFRASQHLRFHRGATLSQEKNSNPIRVSF